MATVFMTDPATGRCALYDEPNASGDPSDPNAPRNAPLNDPMAHLARVYFHSDFDYLGVSHSASVTIDHASVAAAAAPDGASIAFGWGEASANHLLLTHNLGYVPFALVAYQNNIIWPGMPVQVVANGGGRYVSVYCSTTQVRLHEWASSGGGALPAASRTYDVLVLRNPPAPSGDILIDFRPSDGRVLMGRNKFNSQSRYLQVVSGGAPFGFAYGRTIDLRNGAPRAYRPDGTAYEPVPAALTTAIRRYNPMGDAPWVYGASLAYNGSYGAPASVQVQAP